MGIAGTMFTPRAGPSIVRERRHLDQIVHPKSYPPSLHSRRRNWKLVLFIMAVCTLNPGIVRADVVFGLNAGGGHVSLDNWKDLAFGQISSSRIVTSSYTSETVSPFVEASLGYVVVRKYAIRLSVEYVEVEANVMSMSALTAPPGFVTSLTHREIVTMPINVSWEYYLPGREHLTPLMGLGGGYYFTKLEWRSELLENSFVESTNAADTSRGQGFGMHVYVGLRATVWQHVGINSRVRFRYVDGMAFSGDEEAGSAEFKSFDVSIGIDVPLK